jgi:hypothetical protein
LSFIGKTLKIVLHLEWVCATLTISGRALSDGDKRVRARHPHANVAVAVSNAFMVENMTGSNQFVGELFEFSGVDGGNIFTIGCHT